MPHPQELEWREKQYDRKVFAPLRGASGDTLVPRALTYVGSDDPAANVNWAGAAPADELAAIIAAAHGPSGPNYEYLYQLAGGLRALGVRDPHVFEVEGLVRRLRGDGPPDAPSAPPVAAPDVLGA
jgi:gamma-glutamylcyclotransferase, plant